MSNTSGSEFIASGAAVGMGVSATIGNMGLVGGFGGIGLGMAPVTAAGMFTGAAIYGASKAISQGDKTAWGAVGLGSVAGIGVFNTIGGVGLGFGGTAIGLGMGSMAAMGGIFGLGIYGIAQMLNSGSNPEPFDSLYDRMEAKVSEQEFYTEALLELQLQSLEKSLEKDFLKTKFQLLEADDELEALKKTVAAKPQSQPNSPPKSATQTFQNWEVDDELNSLKESVKKSNSSQTQENSQKAAPQTENETVETSISQLSGQWYYQKSFKHYQNNIYHLAMSANGSFLASGNRNGTIDLWDLRLEKRIFTFIAGTQEVLALTFISNDSFLISGGYDQKLDSWNLAQKNHEKTFLYLNSPISHSSAILSVCCVPQKNIILSGDSQNLIRVWNLKSGQWVRNLTGHSGLVLTLAVSADGKFFASGSADKSILIWDLTTYKIIHQLTAHSGWVNGLAFSPDGQKLISSSGDGTWKVWEVSTGNCLQSVSAHASGILGFSLHPGGQELATASQEKEVKIWDVQTGKLLQVVAGQYPLVFSPNGQVLVTGEAGGKFNLYQRTLGKDQSFFPHFPTVNADNWWNVLGVSRNADAKSVKQAYRQLARLYHPDVNTSSEAIAAMQAINQAYEVYLSLISR